MRLRTITILLGCFMLWGLFGCKQNPPPAASAFRFCVQHVFYIKPPLDRVILVGVVDEGTISTGVSAWVRTAQGDIAVTIDSIETIKTARVEVATKGQQVGLRMQGIRQEQTQPGDLVVPRDATQVIRSATAPSTIQPSSQLPQDTRSTMSADAQWTFSGAVPDGQSFMIDGIDVWKHEWTDTMGRIDVEDPRYHQKFTFHVYEIRTSDKVVRFAAGEFSNCIWGFYVRL